MSRLRIIDMFCGMGTIRMGFEQAGHECVYSIEFDKHKRKIYSIIFGGEPEGGDIREEKGSELPVADVWTFGFPCQDISVAGKQKGFDGERSSLFFEVMRLLSEVEEENRPKYLLVENVKNFLSINGGRDFLEALYQMDSLGYDCEWQLLNSKNFGVPQNRERVFIVGHLRGRSTRKVFPVGQAISANCRQVATLDIKGNDQIKRVYDPKQIGPCLTTMGGGNTEPKIYMEFINEPKLGQYKKSDTCQTLKVGGDVPKVEVRAVLTPDRVNKRQNGRRFKEPGEPSFTLTGQDRHGVMITEATKKGYAIAQEGDSINLTCPNSKTRRGRVGKGVANTLDTQCNQATLTEGRIRKLTPKECMRLQGVPDHITDKLINAGISDTQLYRAAGDACTVNVIYEIARRM